MNSREFLVSPDLMGICVHLPQMDYSNKIDWILNENYWITSILIQK